jgi:hypothetical protein
MAIIENFIIDKEEGNGEMLKKYILSQPTNSII